MAVPSRPEIDPAYRVAFEIGDPAADRRDTPRSRLTLEPGKMEQGLLKLVLSLVELIRQLMEKQAVRRIKGGTLDPDQIERVGSGLMELEAKIRELQTQFGIDDLNIDLGPAGRLLDTAR